MATCAAIYALILHAIVAIYAPAGGLTFEVICSPLGTASAPLGAPPDGGLRHDMPPCCLAASHAIDGPATLPEVFAFEPPTQSALVAFAHPAQSISRLATRTPGDPRGPPAAA